MIRRSLPIMIAPALAGCMTMPAPDNHLSSYFAPQQADARYDGAIQCIHGTPDPALAMLRQASFPEFADHTGALAPGDGIALQVAGDEGRYSRSYVVTAGGNIVLPGNRAVSVDRLSPIEAQNRIRAELLASGAIRDRINNVVLTVTELAPLNVAVSGAVFQEGPVEVGGRSPEARSVTLSQEGAGDFNAARTLTTALRAAGGVRPDADLTHVAIVRDGAWLPYDLSGAITGERFADLQLAEGDRIVVPSRGCFQQGLVRPSRVTAPGIRVYLSNLSRPATHNAGGAVGKDATNLPYGTRLSQAMTSANCVGGSALNAGREVVLMSRNPMNGEAIVVSRGVEDLVRNRDRDLYDPFLMPGDSVACYDSAAMNFRDVLSLVGEVAGPTLLFKNID